MLVKPVLVLWYGIGGLNRGYFPNLLQHNPQFSRNRSRSLDFTLYPNLEPPCIVVLTRFYLPGRNDALMDGTFHSLIIRQPGTLPGLGQVCEWG